MKDALCRMSGAGEREGKGIRLVEVVVSFERVTVPTAEWIESKSRTSKESVRSFDARVSVVPENTQSVAAYETCMRGVPLDWVGAS